MNYRVRDIRKTLHLSQQEFSDKLKISRSNLGNIETGAVSITSRIIDDICREYNVNEIWLRTGEGEMFRELSRDEEITKFVGEALADESDSFRKRFLSMLCKLGTPEWEALEKMAIELSENAKKS